MKKQFFYTRIDKEGKEFRDSFDPERVIRSVTHIDGTVIVLLDDFNERVQQVPDIDPKSNKMRGYKNVRETTQSEIRLTAADGERFYKLFNIEG